MNSETFVSIFERKYPQFTGRVVSDAFSPAYMEIIISPNFMEANNLNSGI